jgi:hypothetical protein
MSHFAYQLLMVFILFAFTGAIVAWSVVESRRQARSGDQMVSSQCCCHRRLDARERSEPCQTSRPSKP